MRQLFRTISLAAFVLTGTAALAQTQADPEAATGFAPKPLVTAKQHMIAAANPHASAAGREMLRAGGSAADATIAALLVLNVVEPQSSGIGGGAFALVHGPEGLTSFDARETAPAGAHPEMFMEDGETLPFWDAVRSGHSIGTPGLVRLMEALHARHGKLRWADLFQPAIKLAREGFPVSPRLAGLLASFGERLQGTDVAKVFLPGGQPLAKGAILQQEALALTLEAIAATGSAGFYVGALAQEIASATARAPRPGQLSTGDLANYKVIERRPVCHRYRDARVCGMGPPSSGATTVGQILMILDRFKMDGMTHATPELWHLFAEASRLAYADRAQYLADEDFLFVPVRGLLEPAYIAHRARLIDPGKASAEPAEAGDPPWREGQLFAPDLQDDLPGTTHVSAIDADGLAISVTASIETAFGSGRMAGGFILNNQLTDFSFRPKDAEGTPIANAVAPGKRPRSSMAPTIVYRGETPVLLTGSPGGSRIPEYVAQSIVSVVGFGLDPATAVAEPHISQRNRGNVAVEPGVPAAVKAQLSELGHVLEEREMTSGLHLIEIQTNGTLRGGADPRREGVALGD